MRFRSHLLWSAILLAVTARQAGAADVVINEIMYHPASENVLEEYIEIYNRGTTNEHLAGWRFSKGVQFTFPNAVILPPGGYLVVAADLASFAGKYPDVTNVVGKWSGILGNSRQDLNLDDAVGNRVDSVEYADEGDWAVRQRGPLDNQHQGWVWSAAHDGFGASLELINPLLSNNYGQNWAASSTTNGTPGRVNSVRATNIAPLIIETAHTPVVPRSTDTVLVMTRVLDERTNGITVTLRYRLDAPTPPPFTTVPMFDDGAHDDGGPGDGIFAAIIPAQTNNTVVEFYLEAQDADGLVRTWPAPAIDTEGTLLGQSANLLYQVDDTVHAAGAVPLYKLIMTEMERAELAALQSGAAEANSDAQMNGSFVSMDGAGMEVRYLVGIRNRGHGSRVRKPSNYRVNFSSDRPWKGVTGLNLNGQYTHAQHLGAVLSQRAGVVVANTRAVQVRVNNVNLANNGPQTFGGLYAANEVVNSEWAEHWLPDDSSGNIYRAVRDIPPSDFAFRGPDANSYTNTWFKRSNVSENDWTDLIGMLRIVGTNDLFATDSVRQVVNVEQWMTHLALMALFDNLETGLNSGFNDDYQLYRGVIDPRFILVSYDLDTIIGEGGAGSITNATIYGAKGLPAFKRLLEWPDFEPIYYRTLQRLIDTTFSAEQFDAQIDQTLGPYVPPDVINRMKAWMNNRRAYVQSVITPLVTPAGQAPVAVISGEPRSPTPFSAATLTVGGDGITHYRYRLNNGALGAMTPVATPIQLSGLGDDTTNTVAVIGRNAAGDWQDLANATLSRPWAVKLAWPKICINEVLARNVSAVNHEGTFPDVIELYNESGVAMDLSGIRLTDNPSSPGKFVFPAGSSIGANGYLVLYANNSDATSGLHLGFSLDQNGEGIYLFDRMANGGALLDSVEFGIQIADVSIGRLNGGAFLLTQPSFGSTNRVQATGDGFDLKINEWLASGLALSATDFVEVYNPSPLPIGMGGLFLTANPIGAPAKHRIAPLSFIPAGGYTAFKADGDPEQGADHLGFSLAVEQGMVALLAEDRSVIDCINYGPQWTDISEGRSPNGSATLASFLQPSPGSANPFTPLNVTTQTVSLVTITNNWRYNQSQNLDGVAWTASAFDDTTWPVGAALLFHDTDSWPGPKSTPLNLGRTTYYFRTHFDFTSDPAGASLLLSGWIDDGAVFYLNGQEVYSLGMATNRPVNYAVTASTNINNGSLEGPFLISVASLRAGDNVLAVEVHQYNVGSMDVVMGAALDAVITVTNAVTQPVVLNEVLAGNRSLTNAAGLTPDWIELYNRSGAAVDLSDFSLSSDPGNPRRWVFPQGSTIGPGAYRVIECDGEAPVSAGNTGFDLRSSGDMVFLFDRPAAGGALVGSINFGLQAVDFSIGRNPDGADAWALNLPTPGGPNYPALLGNPSLLKINEWMANPVDDADWFEIYNPNAQPVDLSGFQLTDDAAEKDKSILPSLSFIGAGGDGYQKFIADETGSAGPDHVGFKLGSPGDFIGLYNGTGAPIDSVSFGSQLPDVAQGRFPDGGTARADFPQSASPGEGNFLPLAGVVINELLSHTDPPLEDAVELYNPSGVAVNIGGWYLSNTGNQLMKFRVPNGTVVPPGGFKVIYENQFGTNTGSGALMPFTFNSAHGDQANLSQTNGAGGLSGYRAKVEFGAAANGVSFGRYTNSVGRVDFVAMSSRSFGVDDPVTVQQFRAGTGAANPYPLVGPVVINEIMYYPPLSGTNDNLLDEYVELRNITTNVVALYDSAAPTNTWAVGGAVDYVLPPGTTLSVGEHLLLVSFDPVNDPSTLAAFRSRYSLGTGVIILGPYSGHLGNIAESISLYRPDPPQLPPHPDAGFVPKVLVERTDYSSLAPWPAGAAGTGLSLQRRSGSAFGNDPVNWQVAAPTAGQSNGSNPGDADGDGLPDAWEIQYFGSIDDLRATPDLDPDHDGMTNLQEYLSGTSPVDPVSYLKIDSVDVGGTATTIHFMAVAGKSYRVLYRDNIGTGTWLLVADVPARPVSGWVAVTDPNGGAAAVRFYRLATP